MSTSTPSLVKDDIRKVRAGEHRVLTLPPLAPDALALARMAEELHEHQEKLLVVCADSIDVVRLSQEIPWFDPTLNVVTFPDWETLPYDVLSPQESIISERLETLYRLTQSKSSVDVVLVSAVTVAQRLAPVSFVGGATFFFSVGDKLDIEGLRQSLVMAGYSAVQQVLAAGEFAVRGSLIDVFPMGSSHPFRLDLFDDEIDSIRWFDIETQRSMEEVDRIRLLPGHEFPVNETELSDFRQRWRTRFTGDPAKSLIYRDIGKGVLPPGIEYYFPLFFDETATFADYLPESTKVVTFGDIQATLSAFMRDTTSRAAMLAGDVARPPMSPDELWLNAEAFFLSLEKFARFSFKTPDAKAVARQTHLKTVTVDRKSQNPLVNLLAFTDAEKTRHHRILICASSIGRQTTMSELFRSNGLKYAEVNSWGDFLTSDSPVGLTVSPLFAAAELADPGITILTESELYAASPRRSHVRRSAYAASNVEMLVRDVSELKVGDPVVHLEHGIGRYQGLEYKEMPDGPAEFLRIDYKNDARLFVPIANLHLISRYSGSDVENAPLHTLGRGDWEKARKKASEQARDTAAELLHLYAMRQSREGFKFKIDPAEYDAFREGFAFEETPDQLNAINAVVDDMTSGKSMDRLICGDVGFGKTEVALRAAFVAVTSGKQVAVLCPTTLLAEQHAQTFKDRFSAWPVTVSELSRFRTGRETTKTLEGLERGTVDVVIGTHKLLTDKVKFANLGLVIIDEEHRFGVRQKEMLKKLRAEVDVLTLTATPIPRTLSMSLEGIRDFSVIATPPERRLSVKTFAQAENNGIIREAVIRELKRGGQVYFLHNEVDTINNRREQLEKLLPEARIAIAHGQMGERELEHVMRDFYQQRFNLLLCSTIIETGIDVPTANTIIIARADKLGLAQLHQLRGRVGRSHHQAYAYLLTPPTGAMTKQAEKRLEAIQSLEELGSGFYLAMHDLEIRGAGEVLGEHQSGEIMEVGFDLYNRMLTSAVKALRRGETPDFESPLAATTEINLHAPALLPSTYVPDVAQRLGFYKELSSADSLEAIYQATEALADRYGKLPSAAERLIATHKLRIKCEAIGIRKIDSAETATVITFTPKANIEPLTLIKFLQSRKDARMLAPDRMKLSTGGATPEARIALLYDIIAALSKAPD